MKTFWKIFGISFFLFLFAIILGSYSYIKTEKNGKLDSNLAIIGEIERREEKSPEEEDEHEYMPKERESYSSLEEAYKNSNRINVILMGMEETRSDVLIFISFDPDAKEVNCISIPRDTYIHRKGYDLAEERKINSVYENHDIDGVKKTVSYIFQEIPIDNHVILDYEGVEKVVDSVGGVEVVVPFHMKYDDLSADPPLHIDLKPGMQVLKGEEALHFLRYRKGYADGDLGRIKAQQDFIKAFAKEIISFRLPAVTKDIYKYVDTDINLVDALNYGRKALGIDTENIMISTLPGEPEFRRYGGKLLSYFIFDPVEVEGLLKNIYNVKTP